MFEVSPELILEKAAINKKKKKRKQSGATVPVRSSVLLPKTGHQSLTLNVFIFKVGKEYFFSL